MLDPKLLPNPGEHFFQYRVRRGDKRAQDIARKTGIRPGTLSSLENGVHTSAPALEKLAAYWGIGVEDVRDLVDNSVKVPKS